jgi:hypothetical protein
MEETLRAVKVAGLRRRRARQARHRIGLAAVVVAVLAVGAIALPGDDDQVTTAGPAAERTERTTTTTKAPEVMGMVIERDGTTTETTGGAEVPMTTAPPATVSAGSPEPTGPVCHDSLDPACGEFRWEPAPQANQPLTLSADAVPPLAPGQSTEITVHWADGDALLSYYDSDADGAMLGQPCQGERRFGPWTPPAPDGGSGTVTIAYTAPSTPGATSVTVYVATAACDGYHPYNSQESITIPIVVE